MASTTWRADPWISSLNVPILLRRLIVAVVVGMIRTRPPRRLILERRRPQVDQHGMILFGTIAVAEAVPSRVIPHSIIVRLPIDLLRVFRQSLNTRISHILIFPRRILET